MSEYQHIRYETERGRARVILNRPERHNAITRRMESEVHDALWTADADDEIHAVVLKGEGRSFCSGWDLSGTGDAPESRIQRSVLRGIDNDAWDLEATQRLNIAAFDMHKPVIAQVHGNCLAGGTVLALFCDMVICADDARIGFPAARDLGSLPSNMWLYHLGPQWAKRLTMTGDSITGREAAELGLAMKSVPSELLEAEVEQLLDRLAHIDHHLLSANKRVVNLGLELMGARTLQRIASETDARAHLAPAARNFRKRAAEEGVKAAIQERDRAFGDGRARVRGPERRDSEGRLIEDE